MQVALYIYLTAKLHHGLPDVNASILRNEYDCVPNRLDDRYVALSLAPQVLALGLCWCSMHATL